MSQETGNKDNPNLLDQPKPPFTLDDLDAKLSAIFTRNLNFCKWHSSFLSDAVQSPEEKALTDGLVEANEMLQELIAITMQHKADFRPIDVKQEVNHVVEEMLNVEKPAFYVSGVQMLENGKISGTALYSTVVKARNIKNRLNEKYAELRVKYEARIVQYPVY